MPVNVFKYYLHFNALKLSKHERQQTICQQRNQECFERLKALHAALPRRDTRDTPLYSKKNNTLLAVYKVLIQMPSAATDNYCQFCDIKE